MNFVAIDFETATSGFSGICSMGICVVNSNKVVCTKEFLIKPDPFEFNEYNIKIHNITPEMVVDKPTFNQYWNEIYPYLNDRLIVAHNAQFDVNVLLNALEHYNIEFPTFDYLCTVKLSQKAYPEFESHKLNYLAEAIGVDFSHHHAGDDAYACAKLFIKILNDFKLCSIEDVEKKFNIKTGHIFPDCHIKCKKSKNKNAKTTV